MSTVRQSTVLIVDDEDVVRSLCSRVLTAWGYKVDTAADGDQALARFKEQSFDILLTDYKMPGMLDGIALGHAVKECSPRTHIILMTAYPAVNTAVDMLRLRAADYLIKPFQQEELIRVVKSCSPETAPA